MIGTENVETPIKPLKTSYAKFSFNLDSATSNWAEDPQWLRMCTCKSTAKPEVALQLGVWKHSRTRLLSCCTKSACTSLVALHIGDIGGGGGGVGGAGGAGGWGGNAGCKKDAKAVTFNVVNSPVPTISLKPLRTGFL